MGKEWGKVSTQSRQRSHGKNTNAVSASLACRAWSGTFQVPIGWVLLLYSWSISWSGYTQCLQSSLADAHISGTSSIPRKLISEVLVSDFHVQPTQEPLEWNLILVQVLRLQPLGWTALRAFMSLPCSLLDWHCGIHTKFCCQLKMESNPELQWILCTSLVSLGKTFPYICFLLGYLKSQCSSIRISKWKFSTEILVLHPGVFRGLTVFLKTPLCTTTVWNQSFLLSCHYLPITSTLSTKIFVNRHFV